MGLKQNMMCSLESDLTAPQKAVLNIFIMHRNIEGRAWPSPTTVMRQTSLARSTVFAAMAVLKKRGFLEEDTTRTRRSTTFIVHLESDPVSPPDGLEEPGDGGANPSVDGVDDWLDGALGG